MTVRKRLLVVIGTRPEAIKLAPVIRMAQASPERFEVFVVRTSQHQTMLDQVIELFGIPIFADLSVMRHEQGLSDVTTATLAGLRPIIVELQPDMVVVQGDTATSFAGALAAFYEKTPVAHVEAGLRTYDKQNPFPEEVYRRLISVVADYHFAPTERARRNLLLENVPPENIWVTGNTAIDALRITLERSSKQALPATAASPVLLLTTHRRENQGEPMRRICEAVSILLERFPTLQVICPLHLSPRVREVVRPMLGLHPRVRLIEPLSYEAFVLSMNEAYVILSDSGGVQEEAPALGRPVLVLRDTTERPEAVEAGTARLVGTDVESIVSACSKLLSDREAYQEMAQAKNPFGDGHASERILDMLFRTSANAKRRPADSAATTAAKFIERAMLTAEMMGGGGAGGSRTVASP